MNIDFLIIALLLGYLVFKKKTKILATIGIIIVVLMALVYFQQNILLYMPQIPGVPLSPADNYYGLRHPTDQNLKAIDLQLQTSDKIMIKGWHVLAPSSNKIIVYFHQNAGNIGTRIPYVKQITKKTGSDVILVAYRGYSDSEGDPTEEGIQKDARAIIEYALNYAEKNNQEVYLLGRSLGGAVTVYVSSLPEYQPKIKGIILQNTFTSISDMIESIVPILSPFKFLQRNYWKSQDLINRIKKPILFIMSMQDELVPPSQMQTLREKAVNSVLVEVYQIEEGTHNESWGLQPYRYFSEFNKFFSKCESVKFQNVSEDDKKGKLSEEL